MAGSFIQNDMSLFFAASEFGAAEGEVLYKGTSIYGIFDDEDIEVETGEGEATIMPQTTLTTSSSQVPNPTDGDSVVVSGTTYSVVNWQSDGTGELTLFLKRV